MNTELLKNIENYVTTKFAEANPKEHVYHNIEHVKEVVDAAKVLAESENLGEEEFEIILIAAWFHDIGHFKSWINHEKLSANIAEDFLDNLGYPKPKIELITNCIISTELIKKPKNKLEEIMKDADLSYLGSKNFYLQSLLLKKEIEFREDRKIHDLDWLKINIDFLNAHNYFTDYAIKNFEPIKKKNTIELRSIYKVESKNN